MTPPVLPHPAIAEWVKILISASVGFTLGMVGEPFKVAISLTITSRIKARKMERVIYQKLAQNYANVVRAAEALSIAEDMADIQYAIADAQGHIDLAFLEAALVQHDTFSDIPHNGYIRSLVSSLRMLKKEMASNTVQVLVQHMATSVADSTRRELLNQDKLLKGAEDLDKKFIVRALERSEREEATLPPQSSAE